MKSTDTAPSDVIRAMRAQAKLSQGELARRLGIGQSVLSKFELGRTKVPLPALLAIAEACGFEIQAVSKGLRLPVKTTAVYERIGIRVPKMAPSRTKAA